MKIEQKKLFGQVSLVLERGQISRHPFWAWRDVQAGYLRIFKLDLVWSTSVVKKKAC